MLMEMTRRDETSTSEIDNKTTVTVKAPDSAIEGVIDVVTLRALLRTILDLSKSDKERKGEAHERALRRVLNVNESLAKAILEKILLDDKR
jgi:hypothetical protein